MSARCLSVKLEYSTAVRLLGNEFSMTGCDLETAVPDWIIEHPETLTVFQELGIDYSCGGKSLEYACQERGLDAGGVLDRLQRCIDGAGNESQS